MIISPERRFIFVKTHKTASTTLEIALAQIAGDGAICTPIGSIPGSTGSGAWNGLFNPFCELRDGSVRNGASTLRQLAKRRRYYHHIEARRVLCRMRPLRWEEYFSFCFERNPWDKAYSGYRFVVRRGRYSGTFEEFLGDPPAWLSDWATYTVRDRVIVDRVFRYENLFADFVEVCKILEVDAPVLGKEKVGDLEPGAYRNVYSGRMKDRVRVLFAREIELFEYEF